MDKELERSIASTVTQAPFQHRETTSKKSKVTTKSLQKKKHKGCPCHDPHPLMLTTIWMGFIFGLFFSLFYAHYGADFTGVSYYQFFGFICAVMASLLQLLTGIVGVLIFGQRDVNYKTIKYLLIAMGYQLICCLASIILFIVIPLPTKSQMKSFVIDGKPGRYISALTRLQEELKCCGIDGYHDFKYKGHEWEVPVTCCNYLHHTEPNATHCGIGQNLTHKLPSYTHGCFSQQANVNKFEDFEKLAPNFYALMNLCRHLILILFGFSLLFTIVLFLYYQIYRKSSTKLIKPSQPTISPVNTATTVSNSTSYSDTTSASSTTTGSRSTASSPTTSTIVPPTPDKSPNSKSVRKLPDVNFTTKPAAVRKNPKPTNNKKLPPTSDPSSLV